MKSLTESDQRFGLNLTRTRVHRNNRNSMTPWQVYLLRCSDDSLYCGATTDIERRLLEHNRGVGSRYTRSRLPVRLVWSSNELTKSAAFREEYRIKRLSKLIKEELIDDGGYKKKVLAKNANASEASLLMP